MLSAESILKTTFKIASKSACCAAAIATAAVMAITPLPVTQEMVSHMAFDATRAPPAASLTMGPYEENSQSSFHWTNVSDLIWGNTFVQVRDTWLKLKSNKKELDALFEVCASNPSACPAPVADFYDMIEDARQSSDPFFQIKAVNAWVNTAIKYDKEERDKNLPHRSLVQALIDGQGICDEMAQLKLYALDRLGFSPETVRFVFEDMRNPDGKHLSNHAVIEVRIENVNWVLNDNQLELPKKPSISFKAARDIILNNAIMEKDALQLNVDGKSRITKKGNIAHPASSYNYAYATVYKNASQPNLSSAANSEAPHEHHYKNPNAIDRAVTSITISALTFRGYEVQGTKRPPHKSLFTTRAAPAPAAD